LFGIIRQVFDMGRETVENLDAKFLDSFFCILVKHWRIWLFWSSKLTSPYLLWYISNEMQLYTVYFIWKLLYMFRVVPPPIFRSANNCIYSIWYLSHSYCYL